MPRRAFADKLLDLSGSYAEKIAEQWYKAVSTNPKTPSYHSLSKERLILPVVSLTKNLKRMYFSDDPYQEVLHFLEGMEYAESIYDGGVPLSEAIYALILVRRHKWLYAERVKSFK